jgi:hypothetical protein
MPEQGSLTLKVALLGTKPSVWRRLEVSKDISLFDLHRVLQTAMGWTNSHLHQFDTGEARYSLPEFELGDEWLNEKRVALSEILRRPKDRLGYEYDFGDGWDHAIVLESVDPSKTVRAPSVLAGKGACPPEDVGGIGGYAHFLAAIADPTHPDHAELSAWFGGPFDPAGFDLMSVNRALARMRFPSTRPKPNAAKQIRSTRSSGKPRPS